MPRTTKHKFLMQKVTNQFSKDYIMHLKDEGIFERCPEVHAYGDIWYLTATSLFTNKDIIHLNLELCME